MTKKALLEKPLDVSIKAYKAEQTAAQRDGTDIGTYPQWRATKLKQDQFRQKLIEAQKVEEPVEEVKPKRKRRTKKDA